MELAKYLDFSYENNLNLVEARAALTPDSTPKKKKKKEVAHLFRLYEDWSEQRLMNRASVVGIKGWSSMTKEELIEALRQA